MRVVEVGQYFVTQDIGKIKQFRSVACREYILLLEFQKQKDGFKET